MKRIIINKKIYTFYTMLIEVASSRILTSKEKFMHSIILFNEENHCGLHQGDMSWLIGCQQSNFASSLKEIEEKNFECKLLSNRIKIPFVISISSCSYARKLVYCVIKHFGEKTNKFNVRPYRISQFTGLSLKTIKNNSVRLKRSRKWRENAPGEYMISSTIYNINNIYNINIMKDLILNKIIHNRLLLISNLSFLKKRKERNNGPEAVMISEKGGESKMGKIRKKNIIGREMRNSEELYYALRPSSMLSYSKKRRKAPQRNLFENPKSLRVYNYWVDKGFKACKRKKSWVYKDANVKLCSLFNGTFFSWDLEYDYLADSLFEDRKFTTQEIRETIDVFDMLLKMSKENAVKYEAYFISFFTQENTFWRTWHKGRTMSLSEFLWDDFHKCSTFASCYEMLNEVIELKERCKEVRRCYRKIIADEKASTYSLKDFYSLTKKLYTFRKLNKEAVSIIAFTFEDFADFFFNRMALRIVEENLSIDGFEEAVILDCALIHELEEYGAKNITPLHLQYALKAYIWDYFGKISKGKVDAIYNKLMEDKIINTLYFEGLKSKLEKIY